MSVNLENSAVATGLEKVSFHANPKEPVKLLSPVQLYAVPWTVAYQGPPSTEFSRQKYWSGLPFTFPGDLPDSGIEPRSPALQADALPSEHYSMSSSNCCFLICIQEQKILRRGGKNAQKNCTKKSFMTQIIPML